MLLSDHADSVFFRAEFPLFSLVYGTKGASIFRLTGQVLSSLALERLTLELF